MRACNRRVFLGGLAGYFADSNSTWYLRNTRGFALGISGSNVRHLHKLFLNPDSPSYSLGVFYNPPCLDFS